MPQQVCARTNKPCDINFLQTFWHSMPSFMAWKWEASCYQTIGLYYSGYNRAGWSFICLCLAERHHSTPFSSIVTVAAGFCDSLLCRLSKTLHLSCLFSVCWCLEISPQLYTHVSTPAHTHKLTTLVYVWIKSSIYPGQAKAISCHFFWPLVNYLWKQQLTQR